MIADRRAARRIRCILVSATDLVRPAAEQIDDSCPHGFGGRPSAWTCQSLASPMWLSTFAQEAMHRHHSSPQIIKRTETFLAVYRCKGQVGCVNVFMS
jgi:hypothetical protein